MDIVLVHGGGMGAWVWDDIVEELRAQAPGPMRCLAVDVPGCGTKLDRDLTALDNRGIATELVAEVLEAGLRDVVVVGHSQAGQLIPFMIEHAPELFAQTIYVSCSAPWPGRSIMDTLGNGVQGSSDDHVGWPVDEVKTPVFELFRTMFCNDMPTDAQEVFLSKLGVDTWPPATYTFSAWRYDHLDAVPASYVVCRQDQVLPPAWQRKFAETLRVGRLLSIDAGHQAMNTRPVELAALLLAEASAVNVGGDGECGDGAVRRPTV